MAYQIIKSNSGVPESANKKEIVIESATDLANLPEDLATGSVAYTETLEEIYLKGIDGSWKKVGGE